MRLRLFERLRRIASRRSPDRDHRRVPESRSREDSGRHRRSPGAAQGRGPRAAQPRMADPGALQPPPRLPRRPGQPVRPPQPPADLVSQPADPWPAGPAAPPAPVNYAPRRGTGAPAGGGRPGGGGRPAGGGGAGRARIREAPFGAAPMEAAEPVAIAREAHGQAPAIQRQPWYQMVNGPAAGQQQAQAAGRGEAAAVARSAAPPAASPGAPANGLRAARGVRRAQLPFAKAHPQGHPPTADGRRNCGALEKILWRQWDAAAAEPPPDVVAAIDRLAEFPRALQEKLADGLEAIYVGAGGVPDLDDMATLHGVPLPAGRATWDACAGAYGERKIVVGTRPSPTPDVMCHEVGHALDDLDSPPGKWQSDSAEFRMIYDQCQPFIASDFHRQRGGLGRKEFFADAFAAIASAQRPALVDMLSGNTRIALHVMLYFNRRYGI
jgi:hypothetical protein